MGVGNIKLYKGQKISLNASIDKTLSELDKISSKRVEETGNSSNSNTIKDEIDLNSFSNPAQNNPSSNTSSISSNHNNVKINNPTSPTNISLNSSVTENQNFVNEVDLSSFSNSNNTQGNSSRNTTNLSGGNLLNNQSEDISKVGQKSQYQQYDGEKVNANYKDYSKNIENNMNKTLEPMADQLEDLEEKRDKLKNEVFNLPTKDTMAEKDYEAKDEYSKKIIDERTKKKREYEKIDQEIMELDQVFSLLCQERDVKKLECVQELEDFDSVVGQELNSSEWNGLIKDYGNYLDDYQKNVLKYWYIKEGKEKADDYIDVLEDQINRYKGLEEASQFLEKLEKDPDAIGEIGDIFQTAGEGLGDGTTSFFENIGNYFTTNRIPSALEYKQMFIIAVLSGDEKYKELRKRPELEFIYQASQTAGNMLPTIALSATVSAITAGTAAPAVSAEALGSFAAGLSAAGGAKKQALEQGASATDAMLYGTLSGISEGTMQYLIGGIPGLSKGAGIFAKDLLKEGTEEGMQEVVSACLGKIILDQDITLEDLAEQTAQSFAMGALMSATMHGGQVALSKGVNVAVNTSELYNMYQSGNYQGIVDIIQKKSGTNIDVTKEKITNLKNNFKIEDGEKVTLQEVAHGNKGIKLTANIEGKREAESSKPIIDLKNIKKPVNKARITEKIIDGKKVDSLLSTNLQLFASTNAYIAQQSSSIIQGNRGIQQNNSVLNNTNASVVPQSSSVIQNNVVNRWNMELKDVNQIIQQDVHHNYEKDSFVVVSDFHGADWVLDKVKNNYINEYETIFNLGDITDRGKVPSALLLEYMELSKKNPGRVVYVPGNHDSFIYGTYRGINEEQRETYKFNLLHNGGKQTFEQLEFLRNTNPTKFNELLDWLGDLPLQRTHQYGGKKYALAHAFFNQTIYNKNPNYSLKDYMRDVDFPNDIATPEANILWFRKGSSKNGVYNPMDLPSKEYTMVIGHTENANDLGLGDVNVICVDGAARKQNENGSYSTRKFDGGSGPSITTNMEHHDTSKINKTNHSSEINNLSIDDILNSYVQTVNKQKKKNNYGQDVLYKYVYGVAKDVNITGQYREIISDSIGVEGIVKYLGLNINQVNIEKQAYNNALSSLNRDNIGEAIRIINTTNNKMLIEDIHSKVYNRAMELFNQGNIPSAIFFVNTTNNSQLIHRLNTRIYNTAQGLVNSGKIEDAIDLIHDTNNPQFINQINNLIYNNAKSILDSGKVQDAIDYIQKTNNRDLEVKIKRDVLNSYIQTVNKQTNKNDYGQDVLYKYVYGITEDINITRQYREVISNSIGVEGIAKYFGLDINQVNIEKQVYNNALSNLNSDNIGEAIRIINTTNNRMLIDDIHSKVYNKAVGQLNSGNIEVALYYINLTNNSQFINQINNLIYNNAKNILNSGKVQDAVSYINKTNNPNLINRINNLVLKYEINSTINKDWSDIQKARKLYTELNKRLHYDVDYFMVNDKQQYDIYNKNANLNFENLNSNTVICNGWAQLYRELLIENGFHPDDVKIIGNAGNGEHKWIEINTPDGMIIADATGTFNGKRKPTDLINCKAGFSTNGFVFVNNKSASGIDLMGLINNGVDLEVKGKQQWKKIDQSIGYTNDSMYQQEIIEKVTRYFGSLGQSSKETNNQLVVRLFNTKIPDNMDGLESFSYFMKMKELILPESIRNQVKLNLYSNKTKNGYEGFTVMNLNVDNQSRCFYTYSKETGTHFFENEQEYSEFMKLHNINIAK